MASFGKLLSCLILVKRSSHDADTISPFINNAAAES